MFWAAGGYIIAVDAIPAAIGCLQNAVCFNQMGIALSEIAAGEALGGASLAPAITAASGTLILRKGDQIVGAIDAVTGVAKTGAELQAILKTAQKQELIESLIATGKKVTPENIIEIRKLPNGNIVWLEKGNISAGLKHVEIDFAVKIH